MKQLTVESATALVPVGNMLVVRRDDKQKMEGLIHLPSADVDAPTTGTIIAVGPDVDFQIADPNKGVGLRVAFTKYGGVEWNEDHMILRQEDIMCFIRDE